MDDDPKTKSDCKEQPDEACQDRRQFFNGLGKWSLAVVAAVSSLAGYGTRAATSIEAAPKPEPEPDAQRPAWTALDDRNPRRRMAGVFRPRPHGNHNKGYSDHLNRVQHGNVNVIQ
jgi:hypothetical protein